MIARYLPYILTLRAPAVLTSLGGDPNSSRTLPFIPGTAIRGAVARWLGDPERDPARRRVFRRLILDGSVRYLNAYPRVGRRRALPTPVSFRVARDEWPRRRGELTVFDLAAFDGRAAAEESRWPKKQLTPLPEPFISIGAAELVRIAPACNTRIHLQRDRKVGRAWKDPRTEERHGVVFTFEYLEPGQDFVGIIQVFGDSPEACDELAGYVRKALEGEVLVGRSRRGGYGGDAAVQWWAEGDREVSGGEVITKDVPSGEEFRALLTSAYVGRHPETGQLDPTYLDMEIVSRLRGRAEVVRRYWSFEPVGGFNRKWRLPVPQGLACSAGAVLVLRATQQIPFHDLLAVEHGGLGERRVEGFGRVVFLEAPRPQVHLYQPPVDRVQPPTGDVPEIVHFAESRLVWMAVDRMIRVEATRLARDAKDPPTASLLSRLQNALRTDPEDALATLRQWLGDDGSEASRLRRPAMDQLERCRLRDRKSLVEWLREMAIQEKDEPLRELLRLGAIAQHAFVISEESAFDELKTQDAAIRVRLINDTLAALARRWRSL